MGRMPQLIRALVAVLLATATLDALPRTLPRPAAAALQSGAARLSASALHARSADAAESAGVEAAPRKPAAKAKGNKAAKTSGNGEEEKETDVEIVTMEELKELKAQGKLRPGVKYVTPAMLLRQTSATANEKKVSVPRSPEDVAREKLLRQAASSARDKTGFVFRDADGEYDVPLLSEPRWFWLQTRKNSERKICETIKGLGDANPLFRGKILNAYHPESVAIKMKGNGLACAFKPMIPGLIYVLAVMSPEVADELESIRGVLGLSKNRDGLALPISLPEQRRLEQAIATQQTDLKEELK